MLDKQVDFFLPFFYKPNNFDCLLIVQVCLKQISFKEEINFLFGGKQKADHNKGNFLKQSITKRRKTHTFSPVDQINTFKFYHFNIPNVPNNDTPRGIIIYMLHKV